VSLHGRPAALPTSEAVGSLPVPASRELRPKARWTAVRASGSLALNLGRSSGTAHHDVGSVDAREPWQGCARSGRPECRRGKASLRRACVTPHLAQKARGSAIDGRTIRRAGYALSQQRRKKTEEPFGWAKTVGGVAHTILRGLERVRARFTLTMAANNLAQLPNLLAA
jgi:hypothetical protein